ncbi:hypothetical protein D3C72_2405260 [compost metagenome]
MTASVDHFIHGDGEGALIGTNHSRQLAAGFEAVAAEPAAGAEGTPGSTAYGLIETCQAAGGDGTEFFQGHVSGGDGLKWRDVSL